MTSAAVQLAEAVARDVYGLAASARPLPGEYDRNFELSTARGERFILKLTHPDTPDLQLDFENAILAHLAGAAVPRLLPTLSGERVARLPDGGRARLLTRLPGRVLAEVRPLPADLPEAAGALLGRVDRALADLHHPGMHRDWLWDLTRAGEMIRRGLPHLPAVDRSLPVYFLEQFERYAAPRLPQLPAQVIHNDANDYNLLAEDGRITGLVDFGDALWAPRVCEPAIAAAYLLLGAPDPLAVAAQVVRGYHQSNPLKEQEVAVLWDLIGTRLAVSVCIAAGRAGGGNAYHQVSAAPARAALERLAEIDRTAALSALAKQTS